MGLRDRLDKRFQAITEQAIDLDVEPGIASGVDELPEEPGQEKVSGETTQGIESPTDPLIATRDDVKSGLEELIRATSDKRAKCEELSIQVPDGSKLQSALEAAANSEKEQWKTFKAFLNQGLS